MREGWGEGEEISMGYTLVSAKSLGKENMESIGQPQFERR
jgi:hypothetical protein